jgi:hypothetical protein
METVQVNQETAGHGRRYPRDVRDLAFQHWAFTYSRNCRKVARRLIADWSPDQYGALPTEDELARIVSRWANTDQWPARVRAAIAAIAPDLDVQIIANNLQNAYQASIVMGQVFRRELPPVEVRNYAYAAKIAYEAIGYDAASMQARIAQVTSEKGEAFNPAALASLSPDDLAAMAQRIRLGLPATVPTATPQSDDISQHHDTVDNSDTSLPLAEHTPSVGGGDTLLTPSNADGRDSFGQEVGRREAGLPGCPTHEFEESQ